MHRATEAPGYAASLSVDSLGQTANVGASTNTQSTDFGNPSASSPSRISSRNMLKESVPTSPSSSQTVPPSLASTSSPGGYTIHDASHSNYERKPPKPSSLTLFQAGILSGMASNEKMGSMMASEPSAEERFDTVSPSHPDFGHFLSGYDVALLEYQRRKGAKSAMAKFRPVPSEEAFFGNFAAKKSRFDVQMDDGPRWHSSAEALSMEAKPVPSTALSPEPPDS